MRPATAEERARLKALHEAPMDVAEFIRRADAPLTDAEIEDARALVAWFTRRYPTGAERLAYARRAYARWTREPTTGRRATATAPAAPGSPR
jgi:formylglycine-generating enzyme required for sulfatase activity